MAQACCGARCTLCVACCALWSGHNCFLVIIASQHTPVSGTQTLHRCALHRRLLLRACCIGARCIVASTKPPCDALCAAHAQLDLAKGGLCGGRAAVRCARTQAFGGVLFMAKGTALFDAVAISDTGASVRARRGGAASRAGPMPAGAGVGGWGARPTCGGRGCV